MTDEGAPLLSAGTVALVTGASRGIGFEIARTLVARGVTVVCAGRDEARLAEACTELGDEAVPFHLDVADAAACARLPDGLPAGVRDVNILVNNAGHDAGGRRLFHEGSAEDWDAIIETNVKGLIRVTHALLPGMLERGRGHVVNLGSVAGLNAARTMSVYNASKFAVHGFTEALRKDLGDTDVRVTEILPGLVRTDFAYSRLKGDRAAANAFYDSFPGFIGPADIAKAVAYALEQPAGVTVEQVVVAPTRTVPRKA